MASRRESVEIECGHVRFVVIKGDLTAEKADVIVCTVSKNLDLNRGRASKALLAAAGRQLQEECREAYPDGIGYNEVAIVPAGRLPCKQVFLVALPVWGMLQNEQEHLLYIIDKCLCMAYEHNMKSIALPALGAGLLNYPLDVVTDCTLQCVRRFSEKHTKAVLKTVTTVVFSKDSETYKAFEKAVSVEESLGETGLGADQAASNHLNHISSKTHSLNGSLGGHGNGRAEDVGMSSIMSGKSAMEDGNRRHIFVQVVSGCFNELPKADVFVNMLYDASRLDRGVLPVFELAGELVQVEFNKDYDDGLDPGDIAVTGSHDLGCYKKLYHCYIPQSEKAYTAKKYIQRMIENCLQQACRDGYKSLVFPTLGMGPENRHCPPNICAELLCHGIRKFEEEMSQSKSVSRITFFIDENQAGRKTDKVKKIYKEAIEDSVEEVENKQKEASNNYLYKSLETALKGAMERVDKGPNRGTLDWYKFMYKKEPRTPSYWKMFHSNKSIKEWHMGFDDVRLGLVPVTGHEFVTIEKLVQDTWQSQHVGQGRDSSGLGDLNYKQIKIQKVERIENTVLFEKYFQTRQELFRKSIRKGMFKHLEDIQGSKGPILTSNCIDSQNVLTEDIYPEINEHYMFHGTQDAIVGIIAEQGLDSRLAGASTMFGQGVYAAESSTKADQYADSKDSRSRFNRKMFLIRMCLGKMHVQNMAETFARPPCTSCKDAKCNCGANDYCDSVIGDGSWIFREFVVYDRSCVYPEYIITYDRVA